MTVLSLVSFGIVLEHTKFPLSYTFPRNLWYFNERAPTKGPSETSKSPFSVRLRHRVVSQEEGVWWKGKPRKTSVVSLRWVEVNLGYLTTRVRPWTDFKWWFHLWTQHKILTTNVSKSPSPSSVLTTKSSLPGRKGTMDDLTFYLGF